ncbi:glycosyltransferase family 4 protein [Mucilaginibacter sp. HD30]
MKIAIIVNPLIPVPPTHYGGIERIVYMLIQELIKYGHQVTLYAHPDSDPGCQLIPYTEDKSYTWKDQIRINKLTFEIARGGYDIVHTFGRMNNIALLMLSRIPKVVSYQLPPTLSQVQKAMRFARSGSLHFTACSNYIARQIAAVAPVTTIFNGVDITEYTFTSKVEEDAPLVFLGRIQQEKGTAIAIEVALSSHRNLIIAGNVPNEAIHRRYFEEQVKPYIDGEKIQYIGPVDNVQKNGLLGKALAFLMPVTWDEPFGIVMAEALACGTPVIGFDRGALPEIVDNGVDGFICSDVAAMKAAVLRAAELSRAECRRKAETKFSATVLGRQYEELYKKLITAH